ncbi:MAG: ComEC/Rec2 family competence protein [Planctomycetota bacterium]
MSDGREPGPWAEAEPDWIEPSGLRHRPLVTATVAFGLGILAAEVASIAILPGVLVGLGCAAGLAFARRRIPDPARSLLVLLLVAAAGAVTYACQMGRARRRAHHSIAALIAGDPALCSVAGSVRGEVTFIPVTPLVQTDETEPRERARFRLKTETIRANGRTLPTWGDVRVTVQVRPAPEGGDGEARDTGEDRVRSPGHGDHVEVFGWLSGLDRARAGDRYAASRGFAARMSVSTPHAVRGHRRHPGSILRLLHTIKQSFRDQIDTRFSGETAVILKAVLLGDRERLGRDLAGAFEKSGTMHVLSISGLHVAIVYGAALWLCRMFLLPEWPRRVVVLAAVIAYATTTGFRPATLRAVLMIGLFEVGRALRLSRDPVNAVAAAALIILAVAPRHLFEAGFQLTFVAVLGILMFAGDLKRLLAGEPDPLDRLAEPEFRTRRARAWRWARTRAAGALAVCTAATLAIMPLQAYYFNVVTPVSVVATALLVPVVLALISGGFAYLVVASVWPVLALPLAVGIRAVAAAFDGVVHTASWVPLGHAYVAPPSAPWVWAFYAGLWVVAARRWFRVKGTVAVLAPAGVLCAYLLAGLLHGPGPELAVTVADVGHGASISLTRGRQVIVYDCGSGTPMSTYDVGKGPAAYALWAQGVKRIDLLILSHTDADHVNGVVSLIDRFPVGRVLVPVGFADDAIGAQLLDELGRRGIAVRQTAAGDRLTFGDFELAVLWPPRQQGGWALSKVNDRSLVIRADCAGRRVLLTGDIEQVGMGGVLATQDGLAADLLYVPHHGAREPVLGEFVRAVSPRVAVISSERRSPREAEAVRHHFEGVRLYATWEHGRIRATADEDGWRVETER